jgi:hypothetical protein
VLKEHSAGGNLERNEDGLIVDTDQQLQDERSRFSELPYELLEHTIQGHLLEMFECV